MRCQASEPGRDLVTAAAGSRKLPYLPRRGALPHFPHSTGLPTFLQSSYPEITSPLPVAERRIGQDARPLTADDHQAHQPTALSSGLTDPSMRGRHTTPSTLLRLLNLTHPGRCSWWVFLHEGWGFFSGTVFFRSGRRSSRIFISDGSDTTLPVRVVVSVQVRQLWLLD